MKLLGATLLAALVVLPLVPLSIAPGEPATLTLVGRTDIYARGNNAALGIAGDCAYVAYRGYNEVAASRQQGVVIIDIANPAAPVVVGNVSGTIISGATPRELRADADAKRLYVMFYSSAAAVLPTVGFRNGFKVYDITDCRAPTLIGTYDMGTVRPHEFYLWKDPVHAGRALAYVSAPFVAPTLRVLDLTDPANGRLVAVFDEGPPVVSVNEADNSYLGNYVHSVSLSPDGRTLHLAYWDAGYLIADTSLLADASPAPVILPVTPAAFALSYAGSNGTLGSGGNTHSAMQIPGKPYGFLVDEAYNSIGQCPYGWVHIVDISDPVDLRGKEVAAFKMPQNDPSFCSGAHDGTWTSHNPTLTSDLALVPWHAAGLVVVDLADPTSPTLLAQFVPDASQRPAAVKSIAELQAYLGREPVLMWSYPIVKDGLIYVVDIRNGLYIFDYDGPHAEQLDVAFLEGNSNVGDFP